MANTVTVQATIRKIDNPDFNKEFVIFIKKENGEIISCLVQDDIVEGSLDDVRKAYESAEKAGNLQQYYAINETDYESLDIKTEAQGAKRESRDNHFNIQTLLDDVNYSRTSTTRHSHYIKE